MDEAFRATKHVSGPQKTCGECQATLNAKAEICPHCGVRQRMPVSKPVLLLLTFFLGALGAHKVYLGKYWQAFFHFLFFSTGLSALVALIEFFVYLFSSRERLDRNYSANGSSGAVIAVVAIGLIFIIGIVAAIALPAYHDYSKRAIISQGLPHGLELSNQVGLALSQGSRDMTCSKRSCAFSLGSVNLGPHKYVRQVESLRDGTVLIEFDDTAFPAMQNTLAIVPLVDGRPADLSLPVTGKMLTWACSGGPRTTISKNFLPMQCRESGRPQ